jgi:hypothetical protein
MTALRTPGLPSLVYVSKLYKLDMGWNYTKIRCTYTGCSLCFLFHWKMVPVTYTLSPPCSHSKVVGTVGFVLSTCNSSASSSSIVVLLRADERRGSGSLSSASTSRTGASTSVGAIMGDPGVWTSSSIGRGSLGGRVRW